MTAARSPRRWLDGRRAAVLCLAIALVASAGLLLALDSHLTFIADDWELLVKRQGWSAGALLDPYHENIVLAPAVLYKLLLAVFGMGSALPFYAVSIFLFAASGALLFVYLRRRVGDWLALLGAVLLLFCGAAFEDLLWAFQMGYFGSALAGLGMLLALDREDERGDRLAAALLAVSLAFSSLGLIFVVGALADLTFSSRLRARRAYVALAPLGLYALWWAGWGHTAQTHLSLHNLEHLLGFVIDAAAAGIVSLLGLATGDGSEPSQPHLIWGKLLLVPLVALIALRVYRAGRLPRGLAIALALGLAFWVLAGLNRDDLRFPASSRYQYPSALFLLLIAAEALRGLRVPRPAVVGAAVVTGLALWGGISLMHREYRERWRPVSDYLRSTLAAVDIAAPHADPGFRISFAPTPSASAHTYLAVVGEYGSPAWSEAELTARPEAERAGADLTMAQALDLALGPPHRGRRILACQTLQASAAGDTGLTLLHGGFTLENRATGPVDVMLSRFATELSVALGPLEAGDKAALTIPVDESSRPWDLGLKGAGPVRLCTTTSG